MDRRELIACNTGEAQYNFVANFVASLGPILLEVCLSVSVIITSSETFFYFGKTSQQGKPWGMSATLTIRWVAEADTSASFVFLDTNGKVQIDFEALAFQKKKQHGKW